MGIERAFSEDTRLPGLIKLRGLTGSLTRWLNQLINLAWEYIVTYTGYTSYVNGYRYGSAPRSRKGKSMRFSLSCRYHRKRGIYKGRAGVGIKAIPASDLLFVHIVKFVSSPTPLAPVHKYVQSTLHYTSPRQPVQSQAVHVVADQVVHHQQGSHLGHQAGYFFYALEVCFRQVVVAMLAGSAAVLAHRKYSADGPAVMALQSLLRDKVGH